MKNNKFQIYIYTYQGNCFKSENNRARKESELLREDAVYEEYITNVCDTILLNRSLIVQREI